MLTLRADQGCFRSCRLFPEACGQGSLATLGIVVDQVWPGGMSDVPCIANLIALRVAEFGGSQQLYAYRFARLRLAKLTLKTLAKPSCQYSAPHDDVITLAFKSTHVRGLERADTMAPRSQGCKLHDDNRCLRHAQAHAWRFSGTQTR